MDKNQAKESASKEKVKEVADDKRTEQKDKAEKHGGKDETVLKDVNDDTRKEEK